MTAHLDPALVKSHLSPSQITTLSDENPDQLLLDLSPAKFDSLVADLGAETVRVGQYLMALQRLTEIAGSATRYRAALAEPTPTE